MLVAHIHSETPFPFISTVHPTHPRLLQCFHSHQLVHMSNFHWLTRASHNQHRSCPDKFVQQKCEKETKEKAMSSKSQSSSLNPITLFHQAQTASTTRTALPSVSRERLLMAPPTLPRATCFQFCYNCSSLYLPGAGDVGIAFRRLRDQTEPLVPFAVVLVSLWRSGQFWKGSGTPP